MNSDTPFVRIHPDPSLIRKSNPQSKPKSDYQKINLDIFEFVPAGRLTDRKQKEKNNKTEKPKVSNEAYMAALHRRCDVSEHRAQGRCIDEFDRLPDKEIYISIGYKGLEVDYPVPNAYTVECPQVYLSAHCDSLQDCFSLLEKALDERMSSAREGRLQFNTYRDPKAIAMVRYTEAKNFMLGIFFLSLLVAFGFSFQQDSVIHGVLVWVQTFFMLIGFLGFVAIVSAAFYIKLIKKQPL